MDSNLLVAKSIAKSYGEKTVLKNITISIGKGQFIVVLGHSGSGKSTLLNIFSSILRPSYGNIYYKGLDMVAFSKKDVASYRRNEIGLVFQHYMLIPNLTVRENIELGYSHKHDNINLKELSDVLGIQHLLKRYPSQLSGGEQQRVCIARAVVKKPTILFCDEATGALDSNNSKNILVLLHKIKEQYGTSIVFTTHNREIAKTADRVIILEDGQIIRDKVNREILDPQQMSWEM